MCFIDLRSYELEELIKLLNQRSTPLNSLSLNIMNSETKYSESLTNTLKVLLSKEFTISGITKIFLKITEVNTILDSNTNILIKRLDNELLLEYSPISSIISLESSSITNTNIGLILNVLKTNKLYSLCLKPTKDRLDVQLILSKMNTSSIKLKHLTITSFDYEKCRD